MFYGYIQWYPPTHTHTQLSSTGGWYWYQSFIDRSNIWGVDGTDPLNPEMDHLALGYSYLVEVQLYDILRVLILLTDPYAWDSLTDILTDIDINPSSIGPIFWVSMGPILKGSEMDHLPWSRSNFIVVPAYDLSWALIFLTGIYG